MEEPAAFAAVADSQRVRERERMQDLLRETAQQAQEARSVRRQAVDSFASGLC